MFRVCRVCQWKEGKAEGEDEAYHHELGDNVEVYEDVEVCEDVDKVQDGSVAWPCCPWCWCSLTRLVLHQTSAWSGWWCSTMLALAMLDHAGAECSESVESVSGRKGRFPGS